MAMFKKSIWNSQPDDLIDDTQLNAVVGGAIDSRIPRRNISDSWDVGVAEVGQMGVRPVSPNRRI